MLSRWFRLLRHRWADDSARTVRPDVLLGLQSRVAASETRHCGEIRICIEAGLPNRYLLRRDPTPALVRLRALSQFGRLRVWDTEQNNGVLIYLCLAERAIELVADRGVNRVVSEGQWAEIVAQLALALKSGQFELGLSQAVDAVGAVLAKHYPLQAGQNNPNELPDTPALF